MRIQSIDELNRRFGAPGRIVFHAGLAGRPNAAIACRYGSAEISLLGANTLSYRPTGHGPVLFHSAKKDSDYSRGEEVHGGVPVCWPQFGNRFSAELPKHGFASAMVFEVRGTEYSEDITEVTLGLKSDRATKGLWPHDFDLEVKVSVSMKLNLTMTTTNTGDAPFAFSCGFHPYFAVRSRDAATVRGVVGCAFAYPAQPDRPDGTQAGDLLFDSAHSRVFELPATPKHEFALLDPGLRRAIALASTGNGRLVVWNPGSEKSFADLAADDWKKFVCVEPVSDWPGGRTLAPGEKHVLAAAVQAHLDGMAQAAS